MKARKKEGGDSFCGGDSGGKVIWCLFDVQMHLNFFLFRNQKKGNTSIQEVINIELQQVLTQGRLLEPPKCADE